MLLQPLIFWCRCPLLLWSPRGNCINIWLDGILRLLLRRTRLSLIGDYLIILSLRLLLWRTRLWSRCSHWLLRSYLLFENWLLHLWLLLLRIRLLGSLCLLLLRRHYLFSNLLLRLWFLILRDLHCKRRCDSFQINRSRWAHNCHFQSRIRL